MLLKVSASSSTASVAGAIAHQVREQGAASVQIIGAAALDQAVKALAVARTFLLSEGQEISFVRRSP